MKKGIYTLLLLCMAFAGASVTATNLIATDHDHNATLSSTDIEHSGRTNKDGCHNDKKNGTYHCH